MKNFYSNTLKLIQIANIGTKNNPDYVETCRWRLK